MTVRAAGIAGVPLGVCLVAAAACAGPPPASEARCTVGPSFVLGEVETDVVTGVALAGTGPERRDAVWSDLAGLYARSVTIRGEPAGPVRRLGPACGAGLALSPSRRYLACRESADPPVARTGAIRVLDLQASDAPLTVPVGPGNGVAIDDRVGGGVELAWSSGRGIRYAAFADRDGRLAPADDVPRDPPAPPNAFPDWPAFGVLGDPGRGRVLAWTSRSVDGTLTYGGLYARVEHGGVRPLADARSGAGRPVIAPDGAGGLVMAWRDRPKTWARDHAFVRHFDQQLRPRGRKPRRIGTADVGGPLGLVPCFGGLVSLVPHRDDRESSSLAVRRLDATGRPLAPELAIYELRRAFIQSAAVCSAPEGPLLLIVGERGRVGEPPPRVLAMTYGCR